MHRASGDKGPSRDIKRAKRVFGTVANKSLPGSKYICSPLKLKVSILGFHCSKGPVKISKRVKIAD